MYAVSSIISLIIPLGIGLAGLFAAVLAHRGHATKATWILLISAITYLVLVILLVVGSIMLMAFGLGSGSSESGYQIAMGILVALMILSMVTYSYGILKLGTEWKSFSEETAELEKQALQLAAQRDEA